MEASTSGTRSNTMFIKRSKLLDIMRSSGSSDIEQQFSFLCEEIKKQINCVSGYFEVIKKTLSRFKSEFKCRWTKSRRINERFLKNNADWLNTSISFLILTEQKKRGRPEISFELSSERSKRQKTRELRKTTSVSVLTYATQMSLRAKGQAKASKLLHEVTSTSPKRASKYIKAYQKSLEPKQLMSGEDALAVLVEAKLSRHQYDVIRTSAPEKFPSYKIIQVTKKLCYPKNIVKSDTFVEVSLQALLDHTIERLLFTINCVIQTLQNEKLDAIVLHTKWGFDGSSGHSSYKQAFHGREASDASVFINCIVPIRIVCGNKILWQNPRPASTRYCRPLKNAFVKESTQTSIAEKSRVDNEIQQLKKSNFLFGGRHVEVAHSLVFSMVDGKVCNALTDTTSTQKCYVCGATSKQFNNIEEMIKRNVNIENLGFGLSILHGWIRMFECLLHLSYKLPLKKWQARGSDKEIVANNKSRIHREFKEKCGLIVDKPKPGFGNTNDGNTARRFFKDAELSAEITKVDIDLIKQLHVIMIVVSSGYEIDVEKFRTFALNTAKYFVEKYPWYNMPPTLHKYLIHGPEIISHALLPIGQLTEEAQEARNKDFKKYREHNSRKCSREKTNEDIFNFLLLSSDPIITSKRKLPKKKLQYIPKKALDLLKAPTLQAGNNDDDTGSDNDTFYNSEEENSF